MRTLLPLALLALASCATTNVDTAARQEPRRPTSAPTSTGWEIVGPKQLPNTPAHLDVTPQQAWYSLPRAYEDLRLPLSKVDPEHRTVEAEDLAPRGELFGQPLHRLIDCGTTASGPVAAVYRVQMSLTTVLEEDPRGGTAVATIVDARASDPSSSSAPVRCASLGHIEQHIAASLRALLDGR